MPVEIRPLEPRDRADWDRLWTAYLTFYETTRPPEMFDLAFERLLSDAPNTYAGLIGEIDGTPRGLTHYVFHAHGWQAQDICYLQDLYVDPEARGQGLGRALIEAVAQKAEDAGVSPVYWFTQEDNTTARLLYDRLAQKTPFIQYKRV